MEFLICLKPFNKQSWKLFTIIDVILFRNFLCYSTLNNTKVYQNSGCIIMSLEQNIIILNEYSKFWNKSPPLQRLYTTLSTHYSWRMRTENLTEILTMGNKNWGVAGNRGSGLFHNFWKYSHSYILGNHQSLFPLLLTPKIQFFLSSFEESVSHIKLNLHFILQYVIFCVW